MADLCLGVWLSTGRRKWAGAMLRVKVRVRLKGTTGDFGVRWGVTAGSETLVASYWYYPNQHVSVL